MAIQVRQMLASPKKYGVKCPNSLNAEYITIHNTANDASANNEIQYMINNSNQVSFHYAIDDKEVVQGLPLDRNAWAAGDGNGPGNRKSLHVEICYSKSGGTRYYQAEGLAIQFVAQLLKERGWGIDRVKKHEDWSRKHCPHRILDEGRWGNVLAAIQAELNPKPAPQPTPAPISKPTKRYIKLPVSAATWTVYKLNRPPVKANPANHAGTLKPSKFGGLEYEILHDRGNWVFEIQTANFGRVQIYGHPNTGATVVEK
ncbi:N-acetylmuramoyl-L-alanine amidase [Neobacillus drentensis]|uniref:peptidoglycan recognition protein family protein n=1 Tax=Neobacillus drentensis TaxID=220684 RepID=UPI003000F179